MNVSKFLKMVRVEATHLRDNATKEEKAKLNFDSINAHSADSCIYGQMTGLCNSDRAKHLYPKILNVGFLSNDSVQYAADTSYVRKASDFYWKLFFYTPIEVYIGAKGSNLDGLIKYIKGTNKTLKL
jgi:hypothetical protein